MGGDDTPFQISEECSNAHIAGPRAIILTGQLGLYLGFAIILVIAYTNRTRGRILHDWTEDAAASFASQYFIRRFTSKVPFRQAPIRLVGPPMFLGIHFE
jgi:hypothetical protein